VTAERQSRSAAIKQNARIGRRVAVGVETDTFRQHCAALRGEQNITLRHDARRLVPDQRRLSGARAGKAHRAGAENLALAVIHDHPPAPVDQRQRDKTVGGEWLDIRPHGGEMM
jgi:hypothetical protein